VSKAPLSRRLALSLLAVLVGGAVRVHAQDVTEVKLKGAFVFNFARFTEWPADALPSSGTVSACVIGDRAVGEALLQSVSGQRLNGRSITVSIVEAHVTLPVCHVLYVSSIARNRIAEIVGALREKPVLTVSDDEAFTEFGGIIQVFIESGKMRFRINPRSARRARLQLSSRLLALAEVVDVEPRPAVLASPTSQAR
jgi:YfiR/HmsC-like